MSKRGKGKRRMRSMEIRRAHNGVTIRHETEPKLPSAKQHGMAIDYERPEEHVFDSHDDAKKHVLKHLGNFFDEAGDAGTSGRDPEEDDDDED